MRSSFIRGAWWARVVSGPVAARCAAPCGMVYVKPEVALSGTQVGGMIAADEV